MSCFAMALGAAPLQGLSAAAAAAAPSSAVPSRSFPGLSPRLVPSLALASGDLGNQAMQVPYSAPAANGNAMWFNKPTNVAINVNPGESPESIVRRFKREVMSEGIIQECRRRRFFENAQDVKKRKAQILRRRKINRKTRAKTSPASSRGFRPLEPVEGFVPNKAAPQPAASKPKNDGAEAFWEDDILFS